MPTLPWTDFMGGSLLHHPDAAAGGAAELLPFHPGVDRYVDAFFGSMVEMVSTGTCQKTPRPTACPTEMQLVPDSLGA